MKIKYRDHVYTVDRDELEKFRKAGESIKTFYNRWKTAFKAFYDAGFKKRTIRRLPEDPVIEQIQKRDEYYRNLFGK